MSPVPLAKFQMAPILSFLISSGSKKKEPRYIYLSEDKASLRHKILMTFGSKKGTHIRGLLEKYPTFGREKETGLLGALDT